MLTLVRFRISAFVPLVWWLLFAHQQTPAATPKSQTSPQAQPVKPNSSPGANEPAPQPPAPAKAGEPGPAASAQVQQTPKEQAWNMLESACTGDKTTSRAIGIRVLGLMPNNAKAGALARRALQDGSPEVRMAAAAALGDMRSRASIPQLIKALDDKDPSVALSAAHSLDLMHDKAAYEVYYEILNGDRKTGRGLIASHKSTLSDPKKMAQLGFEEGIGFIPFAGIGWGAIKMISKDDTSPVRAAAAKVLANDPDPATTKALSDAVSDKSWLVRAATLEALARRGDPSVLPAVEPGLSDEKDVVKYTAAAAVLRLTAIMEARAGAKQKKAQVPKGKS